MAGQWPGDIHAVDALELQQFHVRGVAPELVPIRINTVAPGFIDAHGHFPGEGVWSVVVDLRSPPMADVERMEAETATSTVIVDDHWRPVGIVTEHDFIKVASRLLENLLSTES
mgnify:CR=1 FL=1